MQNPAGAQDGLSDREHARRAHQESLAVEPLAVNIAHAAMITGESQWRVKSRLREGNYTAKKAGTRTLVSFQSIKNFWAALPAAKYAAPRGRPRRAAASETELNT